MRFSKFIAISLLVPSISFADRLSSSHLNLGKVEKITVGPGLITVVELPEDVLEARVGAPHIFKVVVSPANPRELLLHLTSSQPFHTNLVVRTVRRTFVFDLQPSTTEHQDFLQVRGGYGAPGTREAALTESSKLEPKKSRGVSGQLLEKGAIE